MTAALLTHSRLKTARECAKLHQYKYILGYRPVEDAAELAFGSLIHTGLEAWWNGVKRGVRADDWLRLALLAVQSVEGVDPFVLARAEVLIHGYHERWAEDAALYEVLGVEEQFEFPLINPATGGRSHSWNVAGKLDVRVRRRADGAHGIVEHKTASGEISPGSFYWARLRLDSQVSVYVDGAASLAGGELPTFILYDVLGKPGQKPLKATPEESRKFKADGRLYAAQRAEDETIEEYVGRLVDAVGSEPDKYFVRGEVVRLESELVEARAEVWQQAGALRENLNADRHPRNADHCGAYGRVCPFFAVCCGEASLEDQRLFRKVEDPHQELTRGDNAKAG